MQKYPSYFAVAAMALGLSAAAIASAQSTTRGVLDACEATLVAAKRFSTEFEVRSAVTQPEKSGARVVQICYLRDGDRYDARMTVSGMTDAEGKSISDEAVGSMRRMILAGWFIGYEARWTGPPGWKGPPPVVQTPWFAEKIEEDKFTGMLGTLQGAEALHGYIPGDGVIFTDVLRTANNLHLRDAPEAVDEHACQVVEGDTSHGHYVVWLDPACGYLPRQARVERKGNDLYYSKPLSEIGGLDPKTNKPKNHKTVTYFIHDIVLQQVDGHWSMMSGRDELNIAFTDGSASAGWHSYERKTLDLNPAFDPAEAFKPNLPDGTGVYNESQPSIRFEWKDGNVVPAVDKPVTDHIDQTTNRLRSEKSKSAKTTK